MVEHSSRLDAVFHALSDPTRRAMLARLADKAHTVGELATPFNMSLAGASKHIRVLETAGLVSRTVQGRTHVCRIDPGPLAGAHQWFAFYEHFWTSSLDMLDSLLRAEDAQTHAKPPTSPKASKGKKP